MPIPPSLFLGRANDRFGSMLAPSVCPLKGKTDHLNIEALAIQRTTALAARLVEFVESPKQTPGPLKMFTRDGEKEVRLFIFVYIVFQSRRGFTRDL